MKFNEVVKIVGDVPHMTKEQGNTVYEMVLKSPITNIIELGFAHGTSACYMAAALDEKKEGKILTIDNQSAKERKPNIQELLKDTGLEKYVEPVFGLGSYTWELMRLIEKHTKDGVCEPLFDFCYLDGAHNFEIDTCAFFLVDKLLKPGAYILFDDLTWTYGSSPSLKETDFVKKMSADEKNTPHIKQLFDLIVAQHSEYTDFSIDANWAMARKKSDAKVQEETSVKLQDLYSETSITANLKSIGRQIKKKLKN